MDAQQFLAEFGHIANAPNGVVCLRELILALAVQGRLVEQLESEEPATVQVERIRGIASGLPTKGRRKNASGIKGSSFLPTAAQNIPKGWDNVPLCELVRVLNGRAYSKPELLESGTPVLRVGNLFTSDKWYYSNLELEEDKYCGNGDLLYAWSASFGPFIWNGEKVIYHYHIWKLDLFSHTNLNKSYLYTYLLERTQEIKSAGHGISMAHMTKERFEQLSVLVPPLEEQSRIVAKVDELMALCDKLEAQQQQRRVLQNNLRQSTLQAVAAATSPHELQTTWTCLSANFGNLFNASEDVADLRSLVLSLAVCGFLTKQDPLESSVDDLLAHVALRKMELVRDMRIKRNTQYKKISPEDEPYSLPVSWRWVRFFTVNTVKSRLVSAKEFPEENQIGPDSIEKGTGRLLFQRSVKSSGAIGPNNRFYKGQILYSKIRPSLNKVTIAPYDGLCSADIYPIETYIDVEYMHYVMLSEMFLAQVREEENRVKMPKLNLESLGQFCIPIPPLDEQRRIVDRVDKLMEFCDTLEVHMRHKTELARKLVVAAIFNLTGIATKQEEDQPVKVPQTELIAPLRLGKAPDIKAQALLATILARHNGEMGANDLWQRFGGEIDAFYAQLKTEVAHGWIADPTYDLDDKNPNNPKRYPDGKYIAKMVVKEHA